LSRPFGAGVSVYVTDPPDGSGVRLTLVMVTVAISVIVGSLEEPGATSTAEDEAVEKYSVMVCGTVVAVLKRVA
jgi:hypothetical protein